MKRNIVVSILLVMALLVNSTVTHKVYAEDSGTDTSEEEFIINESGVLEKYNGDATEVIVPDSVKEIGYEAFSGCTGIEKIVLPEELTQIGYSAFKNCSSLSEINLPSGVTELTNSVFYGCTSLKEITISKGITTTDWYNFEDGTGIERINVAEDNMVLSSIDGVIYNKDQTSIVHYPINRPDETYTIPDSVTTLSGADFFSAKHLKHLIFGKNVAVDAEGGYGFNGSSFMNGTLESFSVPDDNKYYCAADGVLFSKDKKVLLAYPEKKTGEAYSIPNGTTTLLGWSLSKDENTDMELKYIIVPESVKTIEGCVGFIGYYDGFGVNKDLIFFGKKGSAIQAYTKEYDLKFGVYDPSSKKSQLLFDCIDIELGKTETCTIKAIVWPLNPKETVTWKTSKKSVATISKDGKVTACGLGSATITATAKSGISASIKVLVKLPKPINVKAVKLSSTSNYTKLTWDKVDGAKGYYIYLCDWKGFDIVPIKKIGTTKNTSFIDKTIKLDEQTIYSVQAYYSNQSYDSETGDIEVITIPSPPSNIKITEPRNGGAYITWEGTDRYYNAGYNIYRSTQEDGKYIKIGTVTWEKEYTDNEVKPGTTYYYKICSYIEDNNDITYSNYTAPVRYKSK